jgi:drug/metabolite transporter (DMT)-like permease
MLFLKSKFYRHHFFGIFIVVIGLCIVGLNAILNGNNSTGENPAFGIFLAILSQVFSSLLLITEEKLLKGYETPPLKAVGLEGMWGVCVYIILLFGFYFIKCDEWPEFLQNGVCIRDSDKEDYTIRFENAIFALKQIYDSTKLKCYLSLYVFSIAFFNFSGLTISKNVSSTARTIVDTMRTIVIWVFFLTMPFVPEETKETFSWLQLLGFSILILGSVIYNEILVIPFCGCAENTKEAIKKREIELEKKNKTEEESEE